MYTKYNAHKSNFDSTVPYVKLVYMSPTCKPSNSISILITLFIFLWITIFSNEKQMGTDHIP